MSLPVNSKQAGEAADHRNIDDPRVFLIERHRDRHGQTEGDDRCQEELNEQDRVDFPDEGESDIGVTVDDIDTDLEIVWEVIGGRLVHPRVPARARLRSKEWFGGRGLGGSCTIALRWRGLIAVFGWCRHLNLISLICSEAGLWVASKASQACASFIKDLNSHNAGCPLHILKWHLDAADALLSGFFFESHRIFQNQH